MRDFKEALIHSVSSFQSTGAASQLIWLSRALLVLKIPDVLFLKS